GGLGGRLEAALLACRLHATGSSCGRRAVLWQLEFQADEMILAPADRVAVHPLSLAAVIGAHPDDRGSHVLFGEQGPRSQHHPLTRLRQSQFGGGIAPVVVVGGRDDVGDQGACGSQWRGAGAALAAAAEAASCALISARSSMIRAARLLPGTGTVLAGASSPGMESRTVR